MSYYANYTQKELDEWIKFYEDRVDETEILLEELEEHGAKPDLLMFILTKDGQIKFYEEKLRRYKQELNELINERYK